MHLGQLAVASGQEHAPAGLGGQPPEQPFPLKRDAGRPADADHIYRRARVAHRGQRLFEGDRTVLVVTVGDEHHDMAPF